MSPNEGKSPLMVGVSPMSANVAMVCADGAVGVTALPHPTDKPIHTVAHNRRGNVRM
jgi:hypothetical protein